MINEGVGVFLLNDKKEILIGKRGPLSKTSPGIWAIPGGMKSDQDTDLYDTCIREIKEETNLIINKSNLILLHSDYWTHHNRFVNWFLAKQWYGNLINMESGKCEGWEWHSIEWILDNENVRSEGEQIYWIPKELWITMLAPYLNNLSLIINTLKL